MSEELQSLIRELADVYDPQNKDTFVSVYINKNKDPKFLERREHTCLKLLQKDEQKNFEKTMDEIKDYIKKSRDPHLAIFASNTHHFFKAIPLHVESYTALIVDTSPYIRPLARIQDEYEPFTLVLLNSNQAKIYTVELGKVEYEKNISSHIMNKHKKGGWSQQRFQRLRKGAIHKFYTEVIEALEHHIEGRIILAGPGMPKTQFKDLLPKHLREKIVSSIDIDIDDGQELLEQSMKSIQEHEHQQEYEQIALLKKEILKDGLAVYGLDETLQAAKNGQIDVLFIEKDYKIKGCICENCQIINSGPIKDCPICGAPTSEADVLEEILEFTERTNAHVEFTDHEELHNLGHIAAILRFK